MTREEADALIAQAKANWSEVRMCDSWDEPVATLFRLATLGASVAAPRDDEIEAMAKAAFEHNNGPYGFCSENGRAALHEEIRAALTALSNPEEQQ